MARSIYSHSIPKHLRSRWAAIAHDALAIPIAWFLALWLRFNLESIPYDYLQASLFALFIILPVQLTVFNIFGLYRGIWRFASVPDLIRILKGTIIGVSLSMVILFIFTRTEGIPRSIPVLYSILLVMFLTGPRLIYRWVKDHKLYIPSGDRVLIIGGGDAGEMLARDILRNRRHDYQPVAFVDDSQKLIGREIHGLPIIGNISQLPELVKKFEIDLIMLAIPSAKSGEIRRIVEICESTGIPFRAIPHLKDLVSGKVSINELREVAIEDLLGREQISLDWEAINLTLSNKTIFVTGAGGSIGSELCRQIARLSPKHLIILDHSEFNLYQIEMELFKTFPKLSIFHYLGDVTDKVFIESVFSRHKPHVTFHAAAYKHVPLLEPQIRQAMRNNIIGTQTIADAANSFNCEIFVLVSTDKAVNPANIMGATKRAAEIYCQNLNTHSDTNFLTVRFGNVLGSAGSVIPLFKQQIKQGGPVTVTDPRMERFFMTIPEACQLILQTTVIGNGGEIFVLDMGEPVKICYLAEQMIRLSGKVPGEDIQIEFIGLRPGEKLYEELFHEKELLEGTKHKKVLLLKHRTFDWHDLLKTMEDIKEACQAMDEDRLLSLLHVLVPEYIDQAEISSGNRQNQGSKNVISLKHY